jgi:hypothetical protein
MGNLIYHRNIAQKLWNRVASFIPKWLHSSLPTKKRRKQGLMQRKMAGRETRDARQKSMFSLGCYCEYAKRREGTTKGKRENRKY